MKHSLTILLLGLSAASVLASPPPKIILSSPAATLSEQVIMDKERSGLRHDLSIVAASGEIVWTLKDLPSTDFAWIDSGDNTIVISDDAHVNDVSIHIISREGAILSRDTRRRTLNPIEGILANPPLLTPVVNSLAGNDSLAIVIVTDEVDCRCPRHTKPSRLTLWRYNTESGKRLDDVTLRLPIDPELVPIPRAIAMLPGEKGYALHFYNYTTPLTHGVETLISFNSTGEVLQTFAYPTPLPSYSSLVGSDADRPDPRTTTTFQTISDRALTILAHDNQAWNITLRE